jgi:hypothetical protein
LKVNAAIVQMTTFRCIRQRRWTADKGCFTLSLSYRTILNNLRRSADSARRERMTDATA